MDRPTHGERTHFSLRPRTALPSLYYAKLPSSSSASSSANAPAARHSFSDLLPTNFPEPVWADSPDHPDSDPHNKLKRPLNDGLTIASNARTLVRRVSTSMRNLHTRPNKSRKNSTSKDMIVDQPMAAVPSGYRERRPSLEKQDSAAAAQRKGPFLSLKRFRSKRRPAVSCASGQNASEMYLLEAADMNTTRLGSFLASSQRPGACARAAAAATQKTMDPYRHDSPAQDALTSDGESGVYMNEDISMTDADAPVVDSTGADFTDALPVELTTLIFAELDVDSLKAARIVCRKWRGIANSDAVWREVFLRRFTPPRYENPPPLVMGGLGTGIGERVSQPWEKMYRARWRLDQRWDKGNPAAVYFSGHTDSVYCCQFDENKIITGSRDRTIRVWDLHTYKCLKVIAGPAAKPILPEENPLPTHANTLSALPSLNGTTQGDAVFYQPNYYHSASILCLQFDEEIMVTGSSDFSCIVWDINTYQPLARLSRHTAGVLDVCFDKRYIISCSKDSSICIWDRKTLELVKRIEGHAGPVNAVQLRGKWLISASGDGVSKLWDLDTFELKKSFRSRDRGLAAVEFSDDAKHVLAGGNDQVIYKYSVESQELIHTYRGHTGLVRSLFLDSTNDRVLSGSYDQGMRVYEFATGREVAIYDNWTTSWILAAKCDFRRVVATSQDGRALLMDFGHGLEDVELLDGMDRFRASG
ncbi:WD40 repeat-like protein [Aulographum hederae CBS 113979]|uniref:WD40 repeat-like protein n=1 Tax=Aulographum hederae CBS 113979 TaxID=1176131 RepID=A0A6G1GWL5_9PEZI|nr:WD40 repeat-like protein [Aulographum hederae CBS 113979]